MPAIPGYRLGDPALPLTSLSLSDLDELRASLLLGPDDIAALRRAGAVLGPQVEAILDVWYGFVGATTHPLAAFCDPAPGAPNMSYLTAVRHRFGQWIRDTCAAEFDTAWHKAVLLQAILWSRPCTNAGDF